MTIVGLPGIDEPVPKLFRRGTHRFRAPEQTIARVRRFTSVMGITRVANVTGLDCIGVPVVMVCRPNSRTLAVSQGKGLDLATAEASGLMESVELYHAEQITLPLKLGSYEDLRYINPIVDVSALPRTSSSRFHPDLPILWVEGHDLLQDEPVWVPFEMVHTRHTLPLPTGSGCFPATSNGLASGNHLVEAISQGVCEAVERDSTTLWRQADPMAQQRSRIALGTIDDPACVEVIERCGRAGVSAIVYETTTDIGIPSFFCMITERQRDALHPLGSASGMGCHPSRAIALLRALTEAVQSRLTVIAGSRDDMSRRMYERSQEPLVFQLQRSIAEDAGAERPFHAAPTWESDTLTGDLAWELDRLRAAGIERAVVVNLTKSEFGIPVVRVVIPGIEGSHELPNSGYRPGARAQKRHEAAR